MSASASLEPDADADADAGAGAGAAVDWDLATRVARRVAGREALADSYLARSLDPDFASVTTEAEALVGAHTGLVAGSQAVASVVDRGSWVEANVASMRRLLGPLTDRVGERLRSSPFAAAGRALTGTELGLLLGWFSQRVLGQYDLLVPDDAADRGATGDAVYYVGANILAIEKRFAFRPRDFRLWIAIHEVTHRAQFLGVPWMRDYFLGLVEGALGGIEPDPRKIVAALLRAAGEIRSGQNPLDDGGIVAVLATPEHRAALAKVQALMSVLEGHGNRVMNELGREHVAGQARMARVLQSRRRTRGLGGLVTKLVGIDSKLRQYEVGEAFVAAVEREAGPRGLDPVWTGPEFLPTVGELSMPTAWLARVERGDPAPLPG
ncbi:MAG TPA: zinc-dependent metalloprotease [Acidimicrobiia bacterium]|nr:zinc-dependent metalloprotease [Acidimicrobiia bacterium]